MEDIKVNLKEVERFISDVIERLHHNLDVKQLAPLATNSRDFIALVEQWYDIKIEVVSDDIGNVDWFLPQKEFELLVLKHL